MTRFRPNIVVSGLKAFQEVHLRTIRGLFEFFFVCVCVMPSGRVRWTLDLDIHVSLGS